MHHSAKLFSAFAVLGSLIAACPPAVSATYKYTTITNSASPSDALSPIAVNDDNIVAGYDFPSGAEKSVGFVWQNGIVSVSSNVTFFTDINKNGVAAGAAGTAKTGADVVLYNVAANTYQTSRLGLRGVIDGLAINLSGVVVGEVSNHDFTKINAFLFGNGKPTHIRPEAHESCNALDINDNGDVVGVCGYYQTGYLYSGGKYTVLDFPNATYNSIAFITNDGVVGGGAMVGSAYVGFSYFGGVYTTYIPTLSNYSQGGDLVGAFANGNLVGNYADKKGITHGYLYNAAEDKYYQIDYPGAVFTSITRVSGAGSLVGVYHATVNGPVAAFIAICNAKKGCNS